MDSSAENKTLFEAKLEVLASFEREWDSFLRLQTYLTTPKKLDLLANYKDELRIPWLKKAVYWLKHFKSVYSGRDKQLVKAIEGYNDRFLAERLKQFAPFFTGKTSNLKHPLDHDQRLAVLRDDKHNLVVAGAGSGKTSVLTARIAYLVLRPDAVPPEKILALAFTTTAAQEMEQRVKSLFGLEVSISTFHSLGFQLLKECTNQSPSLIFGGDETRKFRLIKDIYDELQEDPRFKVLLMEYLAFHGDPEYSEADFESAKQYYKYMRNHRYRALNGIKVKSLGEKDIANFFVTHDIAFEYEPSVSWANVSHGREYRPDFYLPEHEIYIEHWGLNREMQVAPWFSITSEEYQNQREWKLTQFQTYGKLLVESWTYERQEGTLISNLKERLWEVCPDMVFHPLSMDQLLERLANAKQLKKGLVGLFNTFIQIAKSNMYSVADIQSMLQQSQLSRREEIFFQLGVKIYMRYEAYLQEQNKIDFNDMINLAIDYTRQNKEKFRNRYDHVLVDEFQDISYQRLELLKVFVNPESNTKIFCVGDDWQSIYQFTGSHVEYFVNFKKYFPHPAISILSSNYRSRASIVRLGAELISHNDMQIKKSVKAVNEKSVQFPVFILPERTAAHSRYRMEYYFRLLQKLLISGVKPQDIMVLARFNFLLIELQNYCSEEDLPVYGSSAIKFLTVHRAKGLEAQHVVIIDLIEDQYGFPSEIKDPTLFRWLRRSASGNRLEEERRLFYVALTRAESFLYLFTLEQQSSRFLNEIGSMLIPIRTGTKRTWDNILSCLFPSLLRTGYVKTSVFCPQCYSLLLEKSLKYGRFKICSSDSCDYKEDLEKTHDSLCCPDCDARLVRKHGKYGAFLSCIEYPRCDFAYGRSYADLKRLKCPWCFNNLVRRRGKYGDFLGCLSYPQCTFTHNLE